MLDNIYKAIRRLFIIKMEHCNTDIMSYKMVYYDELAIKYYAGEFEKKIKYYIEDTTGPNFYNKIDVIYNDGIFRAYVKEKSDFIKLQSYIENKIVIVPREMFINLFNERYIFVDINSDFPEYKQDDLPDDYDSDFNYIPKVNKKNEK
jgi:hypothetical protein